jgi:2-succinyl-6-hydroxy-2,4-cyclohexadiene-1-carboxylate synthase
MGRVTVNGLSFNAERSGHGTPLLLLHGFTGSIETWRPFLPALSASHDVMAVDLIGHGGSESPPDPARYSMPRCVEDLVGILDYYVVARVAVLGYSMGARIALHLAMEAPEHISALILEGGSPGLDNPSERASRRAADEALAIEIERDGVAAFVMRWEQLPLFATQQRLPSEVRKALRMQRLRNTVTGLANVLRGLGTGTQDSLWDRVDEVHVPVLLIAGEEDAAYRSISDAMVERMPLAHLAVVPNAGHAVHLEQPEVFQDLVLRFLRAPVSWQDADSPDAIRQ